MTSTRSNIFPATAMPDRDWWEELWPDPKQTLQSIGITPDMTVLDLCCGDGYFTIPLAILVMGKVYAMDLDNELLAKARQDAKQAGVTVKQWIHGDACALNSLLSEKIDLVLIANTFHGVPGKDVFCKNIRSVLKPRGRLVVINWHAQPREQTIIGNQPRGPDTQLRMSPEQTQHSIEPSGFKLEQVIELPPYHYAASFRRTGDRIAARANE